MSTTTSSTAPRTQVTYLAWPGGTSAKWMPRTTPARGDRQVGLRQPQRVADRLGELVEAVPLHEQAARVAVLLRGDLPGALDAQLSDLHRTHPSLVPVAARPAGRAGSRRSRSWSAARPARAAARRRCKPARQATSSTQPIFMPCRSSITRTNSAACIIEVNVPVSSQAVPRSSTVTRSSPGSQVRLVDRGDLQLAPGAGRELAGDLDHPVVVEVQAGHRVAGLRPGRLLLDRQHPAVGVELDHAVLLRVGHLVGEDPPADQRRRGRRAAGRGRTPWKMLSPRTSATDSSPMKSAPMMNACAMPSGRGLGRVLEPQPQLAAVAEQPLELVLVLRRGDDQDLPDPGHHQRGERVVDHRLVEDRHQLLGHRPGDRPEPGAGAAGEKDSTHRRSLPAPAT